jgi:hypothetical protein
MEKQRLDATALRQMAGLFTQTEAAAVLDVGIWTFFGRVRAGAWPKPKISIGRGRRHYYGQDQIEELRRLIDGQAG